LEILNTDNSIFSVFSLVPSNLNTLWTDHDETVQIFILQSCWHLLWK